MTAAVERLDLPHWDVTDIFPNIASREYASAREEVGAEVARLTALYDEHNVRATDRDKSQPLNPEQVAAFDEVLDATNRVLEQIRTVGAYVSSFVATNATDDPAQAEMSSISLESSRLAVLRSRFDAWVASLGDDALVAASDLAAGHAYPLQRSVTRAQHQMSEAEEALLAELSLTGSTAWTRLYGTYTAQIMVPVDLPTGHGTTSAVEQLPMSVVRGLAHSDNANVRRAAYDAELEAWNANATAIIAALNAIKGEAAAVNRRRNWTDDLEPALEANGVDRATLDAMQSAVIASFPDFRRYFRAKARWLGHNDGLPFFDLFAPVGSSPRFEWTDATAAVATAFASYSPQLESLVDRAVTQKWIDAEPRTGKRDGAFCMGLTGDRSLVLVNFDGGFRSVQTLAHELGHAYHNVTLADRTPLQRQLPMALAETASIFCETIAIQSRLAATTDSAERLAVLDGDISATAQVVVDIHSRFLFERDFCAARATRTLSAADACAFMLAGQEATYGDGLDATLRHPYMWAAKPHYYSAAFYNWPYTFGLLFGLGLYARYKEDPDRFRGGYDDLLSSCGLGTAVDLAARFDIDVHDEAFWTASLDVIRARIDEFVTAAT
jgi:pepF/M3 family oligoendopeptidase